MEDNNTKRSQDAMAKERTELSEFRTGMAINRTDMAFERTSLANSQTLLSYFRTAIAILAAGIGMFEFVSNEDIVHVGICLMIVAPVMAIVGVIHYFLVRKKIRGIIEKDLIERKQEGYDD